MKNLYKKGVTLVELSIVLAIIGIVTAFTLLSFSNKKVDEQLKGETRILASAIREVQNYALTGKEPASGIIPCAYRIEPIAGNSGFQVSYKVKNGDDCATGVWNSMPNSYSFLNGVTFSANFRFDFNIPYGTVNTNGNSLATLQKENRKSGVCVSDTGMITEKEPVALVTAITCP